MTKAELFLRKHSSTILTVVGAAGVVATSVLAVKATPKALKLIEDERYRRKECGSMLSDNSSYETVVIPDLTRLEIVKVAWKPYIPATIVGVSTIACIFGANYLSTKAQASLMSAYALLDSTYREYREKTKEICEEKATNVKHEMLKTKFDKNMALHSYKELFWDDLSMRYFESTFAELENAEREINDQLSSSGFACLNDLYDILGIPRVPYGYQMGWTTMNTDIVYGTSSLLTFNYEKAELEDGLECNIITITFPQEIEYCS